jgi:outer membrane protein OmpA-like peptidoglycan-associated protein
MTGKCVEPASRWLHASKRAWGARAGALVLVLGVSACSSIPDYANPVEWYHSTTDTVGGWFSDDSPKIETTKAAAPKSSGTDGTFPNLASVPDKPTVQSTAAERAKLKNELASDRANARYTGKKPAPSTAPKPTPRPTAEVAPAPSTPTPVTSSSKAAQPRQQARLSTGTFTGKRSSLWPNSPPPVSKGDRASTSAKVGQPMTTARLKASAPAMRETKSVTAPAVADKMPEVPKASAVMAPAPMPAPTTAPTFTLTPPGSTQIAAAPMPSGGDQLPKFQLTAPSDQSTLMGASDRQFKFQMFSDAGNGATGVIQFGHGSSRLSPSDRRKVAQLARDAMQTGALVRVVGHASMRTRDMDPFAHTVANFNVSLARANVVALALIEAGVPAEQMIVDAVGDTQPIFSEAMPSGERGNRRTEIFLETS